MISILKRKERKHSNHADIGYQERSLNGKTPSNTTFNRIIFGVTSRRIPFHSRGGAYLSLPRGRTCESALGVIKSLPPSIKPQLEAAALRVAEIGGEGATKVPTFQLSAPCTAAPACYQEPIVNFEFEFSSSRSRRMLFLSTRCFYAVFIQLDWTNFIRGGIEASLE